MMGKLVDIEHDVVTKTTKGLLVFPEEHSVIRRKKAPISMTLKRASAACCNCTMCTDMCPRHLIGYSLQVHKVLNIASHSDVNDSEAFLQSTLCSGCGVCTVMACQQMLDPQSIAMAAKGVPKEEAGLCRKKSLSTGLESENMLKAKWKDGIWIFILMKCILLFRSTSESRQIRL